MRRTKQPGGNEARGKLKKIYRVGSRKFEKKNIIPDIK